MMKTLADLTVLYVKSLEKSRGESSILRRQHVLSMTQIFVSDTYGIVQDNYVIEDAGHSLINAARLYTGGPSFDLLTMRNAEREARDYEIFMTSARRYLKVLESAQPAPEAKLLGRGVDATKVPTPLFD